MMGVKAAFALIATAQPKRKPVRRAWIILGRSYQAKVGHDNKTNENSNRDILGVEMHIAP